MLNTVAARPASGAQDEFSSQHVQATYMLGEMLFGLFDEARACAPPTPAISDNLGTLKFALRLSRQKAEALPMYQVQTLAIGVQEMSPQEQANLRLFLAARRSYRGTGWATGGKAVNSARRACRPEPKPSGKRLTIRRWIAPAPALFTMIGIVLFGITVTFQQPSRTDARYREEANAALAIGDFTTSRLCFERLLQTTQNDPSLWYGLARSLDGLHQVSHHKPSFCASRQSMRRISARTTVACRTTSGVGP